MVRAILKGSTDQSVVIRIIDAADGTPETGVEHNTTGIDLWYRREGGSVVSITEASLAAANSAHADGGIEHLDDGYYRLDLPDAAFASGADGVMIGGTVTDMVVIGCYVPLVGYNPQDAVRLGLTALPNANADAAGGLPISDAGGLDLDTFLGRITGNVALASVLGALNDSAADGDPTNTDTVVQYAKQLINVLMGSAGIVTWPSSAAPGNAVSLAEAIRQIYDNLNTVDDLLDSEIGALTTELAKVPKSDSTVGWNATARAQIQQEVEDGLAAYDPPTRAELTSDTNSVLTAVGDVPTNAELATALGTADDAVLAAISGLNNLSSAQAQTAAAAALTAYDPPTNTEMEARTLDGTSRDKLDALMDATLTATVNDGSASTTAFVTTLASSVNDFYNGRLLTFTSGALAGQQTAITDYVGSTKTVTVVALTAAPANGVSFVVS